jgi:Domain of unknown function (DUF4337)
MKAVPMVTGLLAGLAGFLTVRSGNMSNQAIYNSTQAALHSTLATDFWAEYQASSEKRHGDQNALRIGVPDPADKLFLQNEINDMKTRQDKAQQNAHDEEYLRADELQNSAKKLEIKDLIDYAGMAAQLGIALASIAALTKKSAWFYIGTAAGAIALAVTGYALAYPALHQYLAHH